MIDCLFERFFLHQYGALQAQNGVPPKVDAQQVRSVSGLPGLTKNQKLAIRSANEVAYRFNALPPWGR
ncbi:hypothetical protein [Acidithiobacillus ferrooxidans]|uniref:hypothetical protein n=1 Tax=Acidithiobacillus ferrooxidans TaxID=920 RepID=UPI001C0747D2|nr:hypothetical protein [Acidithiobacillus ferrooxidans]